MNQKIESSSTQKNYKPELRFILYPFEKYELALILFMKSVKKQWSDRRYKTDNNPKFEI